MKIMNFGSCNIDYVYSVDRFVKAGETISVKEMDIFPGGKGLNQSIALAKAGADVIHAGFIGNDAQILKDALCGCGVDVSYLKEVDMKNGHAIIQVDANAENCILVYGGTNHSITREYIDSMLSCLGDSDILVLQNEINDIAYIIDKAYSLGISTVFNPAPFTDDLKEIDLAKVRYLIVNETEALELSGKDNPKEFIPFMRESYPALSTVMTLGRRGCVYIDKDKVIKQPSYKVKAVDTTAAGDTFIGYFIANIAKGTSEKDALKMAAAASAIAVSRRGAAPSVPYMDEVKQLMPQMELSDVGQGSKNDMQKKEVFRYIDEHLADASVAGLAAHLGYSKNYVSVRVREVTGVVFSELLCRRRCEVAARYLRETDMSVGEIISKIGYENESFFRRKFAEIYGKNPLRYRKEGE